VANLGRRIPSGKPDHYKNLFSLPATLRLRSPPHRTGQAGQAITKKFPNLNNQIPITNQINLSFEI